MAGERTEKATPRRLRQAREQGRVSASRDLTATCVVAAGLLTVAVRADGIAERARELLREAIGYATGPPLASSLAAESLALGSLAEGTAAAAAELAPVLFAMALCGILVSFLQVGPIFTLEPLRPRLAPLSGSWMRYFSPGALVAFAKAAAKFAAVAAVLVAVLYTELGTLLSTSRGEPSGALAAVARVVARLAIWTTSALFLIGLMDLFHQRAKLAKELRMSVQEKRAESRESQGGSQGKAERRRLGLDDSVGSGLDRAHFVVTDASGAACAFEWSPGQSAAPRLVAKGLGSLAAGIIMSARRRGLPVTVDTALTRGGYQMEVGEVIGDELFGVAWGAMDAGH